MTQATIIPPNRWQEITEIWKDNRWLYVLAGLLLGILFTPALEQMTGNLNNLIGNLVPEAVGIVFTVLILNRLSENRDREALQQRLLREVSSSGQAVAVSALDWLRAEDWLETLKGADLQRANWENTYVGGLDLSGANLGNANLKGVTTWIKEDYKDKNYPIILEKTNLEYANLQDAKLWYANLQQSFLYNANLQDANLYNANLGGASLYKANLQKAYLEDSNLQDAYLEDSNLQDAYLEDSNLQDANLGYTNLQKATLRTANLQNTNLISTNLQNTNLDSSNLQDAVLYNANLRGANLKNVQFNERTVLPDAKNIGTWNKREYDKYWTAETDMTRYTDPEHPDFWEPDYLKVWYPNKFRFVPPWVKDWHKKNEK